MRTGLFLYINLAISHKDVVYVENAGAVFVSYFVLPIPSRGTEVPGGAGHPVASLGNCSRRCSTSCFHAVVRDQPSAVQNEASISCRDI